MADDLSNWTARAAPTNAPIEGRTVRVEPWDATVHATALWRAFGEMDTNTRLYHFGWPRLGSAEEFGALLDELNMSGEFITCVFTKRGDDAPTGMASYMRVDTDNGVVETGAIGHGAALARTPAATEAHYLMARRVFDELGYRRYEWKLNDPNTASHAAARRFGFTFEGVFRQHMVRPYGNRDTAWYSMIDKEWPLVREAFERWLDPANFDDDGRQRARLEEIRESIRGRQAEG